MSESLQLFFFFFSSRRRHTRSLRDWSSDVCSSDLTWDSKTLATFAKHYETNEPIPPALVEKLRASRECCTALNVAGQIAFARLSLSLFDRDQIGRAHV